MDGVLKTPVDIANRKMPAKAHNFHLRALKWVCVWAVIPLSTRRSYMHYAYPNITGDIGQGMSFTEFEKNRVEMLKVRLN